MRFRKLWLTPDDDISNDPKTINAYRTELQQEIFETAVEKSVKGGLFAVHREAGAIPDPSYAIHVLGASEAVEKYIDDAVGDNDSPAF